MHKLDVIQAENRTSFFIFLFILSADMRFFSFVRLHTTHYYADINHTHNVIPNKNHKTNTQLTICFLLFMSSPLLRSFCFLFCFCFHFEYHSISSTLLLAVLLSFSHYRLSFLFFFFFNICHN